MSDGMPIRYVVIPRGQPEQSHLDVESALRAAVKAAETHGEAFVGEARGWKTMTLLHRFVRDANGVVRRDEAWEEKYARRKPREPITHRVEGDAPCE